MPRSMESGKDEGLQKGWAMVRARMEEIKKKKKKWSTAADRRRPCPSLLSCYLSNNASESL